ncbi:MAG: glycosyltransferase family 2 protein [Gammaproteobacteria bacterium]
MVNPDVPLFSVVIPTFNRPSMLKRAVLSVLAQSYSRFEVIVVDDGSSTPCDAVLRELGSPCVRLLRSEHNRGQGAARNLGIEAARGDYIAFLDDDDQLQVSFLEASYSALRSADSRCAFSWCSVGFIDEASGSSVPSSWRLFHTDPPDETLLLEQLFTVGIGFGFTFRADCLRQVGAFRSELRFVEDTDLFIRMVQAGFVPIIVASVGVLIHNHGLARLTGAELSARRIRECECLLEEYAVFFLRHPTLRAQLTGHLRHLDEQRRQVLEPAEFAVSSQRL